MSAHNPLTNFVFDAGSGQTHAVRGLLRNAAPWFIASDVAAALGYRNAPDMVRMLDEDEADTHNVRIRSDNGVIQEREFSIINESGLYSCILKSRRPEARAFRKWVTSEVLPSIRKTGQYTQPGRVGAPGRQPSIPAHAADRLVAASRTFNALVRSARTARVPLPVALRRAAEVAERETGIDLLAELRVQLPEHVPSEQDTSGVLRFWQAFAAGECPPLDARQPLLATQLHQLYRLWAQRQSGVWPLGLAPFIAALQAGGYVRTSRKRYLRADASVQGPHSMAWPLAGAAAPQQASAFAGEAAWLGHCIAQAQRALAAYASAESEARA